MFAVLQLIGLLPLLGAVGLNQAAAATIFPTQVVYSDGSEETEEAKVCEIILDIANPPSREVVKFIMFAGYDKSDDTVLAGFLMAAAEITTIDTYEIVQISDAAFNSEAFSSLGQLGYDVYDDGAVMAPTDNPEVAKTFIGAVLAGNFEVSFSRSKPSGDNRIYEIVEAPPDGVMNNFVHCMERLVSETNLARLPATSKSKPADPIYSEAVDDFRNYSNVAPTSLTRALYMPLLGTGASPNWWPLGRLRQTKLIRLNVTSSSIAKMAK